MTIKDLEKVKKAVIRRYPIAASLALEGVDIELSDRIPTACVVGERNKAGVLEVKKMQVNPEFFDLLTFNERVFVLAHECCHIALKHFKRATKKPDMDAEKKYQEYCEKETDPQKRELKKNLLYRKYHNMWNIATDACINAFLKKDGLAFPNNVVDPKTGEKMQFVDMEDGNFKSAEKIYDYLVKKDEEKQKEKEQEKEQQRQNQQSMDMDGQGEPQEGKDNDQQQSNSNSDTSSDSSSTTSLDDVDIDDYQGIDSHEDWTGQSDENDKEDSNKQEKESDGEPQDSDEDDIDEEDIFNKELEERENKNKSKNQSQGDLKDAFAKLRGGLGMGNPMKIKPVISWKDLLVGTLEKTEEVWGNRRSSRFNPNAKIEERTFEGMPEVEVIMDSSGSISSALLLGFLLQLYPLFESMYDEEETIIRVGCFGNRFSGFTDIRSRKDIEEYKPFYGGGTDFEVAATSFSKDPGGNITKIVFTDGQLGTPQTTRVNDIIWIVFGNSMDFKPVGGRIIRVSDKEYDEIMETGRKVEEKKRGKHR